MIKMRPVLGTRDLFFRGCSQNRRPGGERGGYASVRSHMPCWTPAIAIGTDLVDHILQLGQELQTVYGTVAIGIHLVDRVLQLGEELQTVDGLSACERGVQAW